MGFLLSQSRVISYYLEVGGRGERWSDIEDGGFRLNQLDRILARSGWCKDGRGSQGLVGKRIQRNLTIVWSRRDCHTVFFKRRGCILNGAKQPQIRLKPETAFWEDSLECSNAVPWKSLVRFLLMRRERGAEGMAGSGCEVCVYLACCWMLSL